MSDTMDSVVLVHGLWMGPWAMKPLAGRLVEAGFRVRRFGYRPVRVPFEINVQSLADTLQSRAPGPIGIVAHSLGGLLTAAALARVEGVTGRVLLLGSPLAGSEVARRIHDWPGGAKLLGHAFDALREGVPLPDGPDWVIAQIAGSRRLGAGLLAGAGGRPGDGTVAISETDVPGLSAHVVLPVTHTTLLGSRRVSRLAAAFLATGTLNEAAQRPRI